MSIGRKFALTGGALIVSTMLLGVVSLVGLVRIEKHIKTIGEDALDGVTIMGRVESALLELRGDVLKHLGSNDDTQIAALDKNISKLKGDINTDLENEEKSAVSVAERDLVGKIRPALQRYYQVLDEVDRKSTRLNSSHIPLSRMPSSA